VAAAAWTRLASAVIEIIAYSAVAAFGAVSGLHALLNKRDPRSTLGWLVVCFFVPAIGALLYWIIGNNRIRTRARRWQEHGLFSAGVERASAGAATDLAAEHPAMAQPMASLLQIAARVTRRPLLRGNQVEPLFNGEQAYPAMLDAIASAHRSVCLCTYLFDSDATGRRFVDALGAATARGVSVRVLVDAIGERYARPRISRWLRRHPGIEVARFLPLTLSLRGLRLNLRNHRKLLIVDSEVGFTGGMNIGGRHLVADEANRKKTADLHFRVTGPIVYSMEQVFYEDWHFATKKLPDWRAALPPPTETGGALCRGISDGPNEDFEKLQWILVGALSCARERVQIMTPYFIPSRELLAALNAAVLRGVAVDIVLPRENNLPFVAWAAQAMLPEVIQYGIRVYYQPPPFNHGKLLIVDEFYVVVGSANLDPRSLRLNFEFNLEVFDQALAKQLSEYFDEIRRRSAEITADELAALPLHTRFRDACAKLMSPYL
jgi:cardiolipin synthase A/B